MVIDSTIDSLRGVSYNVIIHYYVNFSPLLPSMITQWMKKVFHLQNGNVSSTVIIIMITLLIHVDHMAVMTVAMASQGDHGWVWFRTRLSLSFNFTPNDIICTRKKKLYCCQ